MLRFGFVFAQAPNISYSTPQTYLLNKPINPLQPVNTGGTVPATIYGTVSIVASGFNTITGVAVDGNDYVYGEDWGNNQIKKFSPAGSLTVFAGSGTSGATNGQGTAASFFEPDGIILDASGNLFIADQGNNLIRKITPTGLVSTFAGSGATGATNGIGTAASFNTVRGLTIDAAGTIYVADQANNMIRKVTAAGVVSTYAGSTTAGFTNGSTATATFNTPAGVGLDNAGNLFVTDAANNAIRKITPGGIVTTFATGFNFPREVRVDGTGNLYVSEQNGNIIKRVSPTGVSTTIATVSGPIGLILDGKGNLYTGDNSAGQIKKIAISGYTIDKPLPAGLTFDPKTGVISGTPTALSSPTVYNITAYNGGGSSTTAVTIDVALTIPLKPSIITFPPPVLVLDANNNYNPNATSTNNETPITYTSSNPAVATVTPDGLIHVIAPGVSNITAYQAGNANYLPASPVTQILTVVEYLSVNLPVISTKTICDADFNANATSGNTSLPITYTSSNTNVATISGQGIIHITGVGSTTITAYKNGSLPLYVSATPQAQTLTITQPVTPTININVSYASPCAGSPVTFTSTVNNAGTAPAYQWQVNGNNSGNNATFSSSSLLKGDKVTCTVTNNNTACLAGYPTTSNIIDINLITPSAPSVSITASTNYVYSGVPITFTATTKNALSAIDYQWQVNGINVGTNSNTFTSSSFVNGDVVTCSISSATACTTPDTSTPLTVTIVTAISIPNTFTPNGDGINDNWNIIGIANYPDCQVNIYNRYGGIVYQSKGYPAPWDGVFNSKPLPAGTYYYLITDKLLPAKLSGSITLIR